MIEPTYTGEGVERPSPAETCCSELDMQVRRYPAPTILLALGIGLLLGLIVRAARPEPKPAHRLAALLRNVEEHLHDLSAPTARKASRWASDGADAVRDGEAKLEKIIRDAGRRMRSFWN